MCGGASGDGDENDWLAQAALSSKGSNRNCGKREEDPNITNDDPYAVQAVLTTSSPGGNSAHNGKVAASADWLTAAAASSSKWPSKAGSAKANNASGGASAPASWLTPSIANGKLGNPRNDDEIGEVTRDSAKDAATQTDVVTTAEGTTAEETSEKPKSKLPPWAKPWTPPTPASASDAHPTSLSPTEEDGHQAHSVDKDGSNADGHSAGGSGGLDWISATVTGEEKTNAPTGCKYCSQRRYHHHVNQQELTCCPVRHSPNRSMSRSFRRFSCC